MPDIPISVWLHAHTHPGLTAFMWAVTQWHSILGVSLMAAALAVLLYRRGEYAWLRLLALSVPGGMLLNAGLKQVFRRVRPQFEDPMVTLGSYSFPSGHTNAATVFYGFLVLLLLAQVRGRGWRVAIICGAVVMVLLVALSRLYLGAHYLSDVLAAMLEGVLWLAFCVALMRRLDPGRREAA